MKVRLDTIELSAKDLSAIAHAYGAPGKASRKVARACLAAAVNKRLGELTRELDKVTTPELPLEWHEEARP